MRSSVQFGTDSEQNHIFDVLDSRYREMRPTIILTNMDKEGLKGFVGDRVFDRMTEVAKWVPFAWASYRTTARDDWDIAPDGYSARQWVVPKPRPACGDDMNRANYNDEERAAAALLTGSRTGRTSVHRKSTGRSGCWVTQSGANHETTDLEAGQRAGQGRGHTSH